jgi:hypothetical protein
MSARLLTRSYTLFVRRVEDASADRQGPVTLLVGGCLLTGYLTTCRAFLRGSGAQLAACGSKRGQGSAERLSAAFESLLDRWPPPVPHKNAELVKWLPACLHMRDVVIRAPGGAGTANLRAGWWRIRIDSIDAFAFGSPIGVGR